MSAILTNAAVERTCQITVETPRAAGPRFGVCRSGCSSWFHALEIPTASSAEDVVFEQDGVEVRGNPRSMPEVDGTRIDFVKNGLNQQLVFARPRMAA